MSRYLVLIAVPLLVVVLCFAGLRVYADSTGDTLKAFGLIGQWSPNCAGNQRLNYDVSVFGSASFTRTTAREVVETRDIQSAERLTEDKIRIKYLVRTNKTETALNKPGELWEVVTMRFGNKFRAFSSKQLNGAKVAADGGYTYKEKDGKFERTDDLAGVIEKCLTDG